MRAEDFLISATEREMTRSARERSSKQFFLSQFDSEFGGAMAEFDAEVIVNMMNSVILTLAKTVDMRKLTDEAKRFYDAGGVVHPYCGVIVGELIGKRRDFIGGNTMIQGICDWCGQPGGVSTVYDWTDSGWWD